MKNQPILQHLDHELVRRMTSRRDVLSKAARMVAGVSSVPIALGALARSAFAYQALPQQIVDVLNFALLLEERETDFYTKGLDQKSLVPQQFRKVIEQIRDNEAAHVKLLRGVLGDKAMPKPAFDVTGGGLLPDILSNWQTFAGHAQQSEETGVRAYKGQAANLMSNDKILTTALRIHSVEGRHVSELRRIRGEKGWITGSSRGSLPPIAQPTYEGEGNTTQNGVELASLFVGGGAQSAAATGSMPDPNAQGSSMNPQNQGSMQGSSQGGMNQGSTQPGMNQGSMQGSTQGSMQGGMNQGAMQGQAGQPVDQRGANDPRTMAPNVRDRSEGPDKNPPGMYSVRDSMNIRVPETAFSEAFDEPLTKEEVMAIIKPFVKGMQMMG